MRLLDPHDATVNALSRSERDKEHFEVFAVTAMLERVQWTLPPLALGILVIPSALHEAQKSLGDAELIARYDRCPSAVNAASMTGRSDTLTYSLNARVERSSLRDS